MFNVPCDRIFWWHAYNCEQQHTRSSCSKDKIEN